MSHKYYEGLELLPVDVQGWNSYNPAFRTLVSELKPTVIIEVGTWKGASTIHMASICRQLGLKTIVYGVDVFAPTEAYPDVPPNLYQQFLSNVVAYGLQEFIVPVKMTSDEAYQHFLSLGITAELIYLDGNHTYEFVKKDIENYRRLVKPSGVLFGDDYIGWPGVIQAVDEYRAAHSELLAFGTSYEKWIMQIP